MGKLPKLTTIYIVRHGETEWNTKGLLQGHGDSPLTPTGIAQAKQTANLLKNVRFDAVFSSDLLRAKRTAEIISLEQKLAVKTTKMLRERSFGKYEGKRFEEYNQELQKLLKSYSQATSEPTPLTVGGAESIESGTTRIITFLREIAVGFPGKNILAVTHGGLMRHFLIHIGFAKHDALPPHSISNTAIIHLESDGVDFFIKEVNGVNIQNL